MRSFCLFSVCGNAHALFHICEVFTGGSAASKNELYIVLQRVYCWKSLLIRTARILVVLLVSTACDALPTCVCALLCHASQTTTATLHQRD